jgi:hypothetical protein
MPRMIVAGPKTSGVRDLQVEPSAETQTGVRSDVAVVGSVVSPFPAPSAR